MKKTALLINCSRGGIINEVDLAEALKAGVIAGAGTDVYCNEPPEADDPLLNCPESGGKSSLCRTDPRGSNQDGADVHQWLSGSRGGKEMALRG